MEKVLEAVTSGETKQTKKNFGKSFDSSSELLTLVLSFTHLKNLNCKKNVQEHLI